MGQATTTETGRSEPLAIICGGGAFPLAVAEAASRSGRSVTLFPVVGFAGPEVERYPHVWIRLGAFGTFEAEMRKRGCRDVVIVGTVFRPRLRDLRLDWTTIRLLPRVGRLLRGGDDHLLSGVGRIFEDAGFRLIGAHEVAPGILLPPGLLGAVVPTEQDRADARQGIAAVHALGDLDIGQAVVVANGHVIAVEAAEGTDLMLARCKSLREIGRIKLPARCGVLVKAAKPRQDRRIDLPSVGPRTVENAAAAGLAGIALEAGSVIAADLEATIAAADRHGLFLLGMEHPA